MKQFDFSLESVLQYKLQVLDSLQGEHAACTRRVHEQEKVLTAAQRSYQEYNDEYRLRKAAGILALQALCYQSGLRAKEAEIRREAERLKELRGLAEEKRRQVVEAKKDTASLEKLREKKWKAYQRAVQKDEEQRIDEFVGAAKSRASAT